MGHQRLNVLVVDDQPGVRYLLDAVVKEEGHDSKLLKWLKKLIPIWCLWISGCL